MSTPSGTTQDLETALTTARAENLRLLKRCNAITAEQKTLGYTPGDELRYYELQAEWRTLFDAAKIQLDTALHLIDVIYAQTIATTGTRNA
jgi:hypothetical protein